MGVSRVQINNPGDGWLGTKYFIDGVKVPHVRSVDFRVAVDEVPTFTFETLGKPDIDNPGDVKFSFKPENLSEACFIISEELKKHGDFYNAFVESVHGVLKPREKDIGDGCFSIELTDEDSFMMAEEIVKRISGEE